MPTFLQFVSRESADTDTVPAITEACACLDRFTQAFNECDIAGMDAELHFPHVMLSGGELLTWNGPGQHPTNFFDALRKTGWARTAYVERTSLLASADKVHFHIVYERRDSLGVALSTHVNVWIVTRQAGRWGIAMRSY